jgi:hypothetical protein
MQMLVKEDHGFTLIREGTPLDDELTTRPIAGVDWTVDTTVIYRKQRYPKTIPILVRNSENSSGRKKAQSDKVAALVQTSVTMSKRPAQPIKDDPVQLTFFREAQEEQ